MERAITPEVHASLIAIIAYLELDEEKHWQASGRPASHIFRDVERVSKWLSDEA